MVHVAFPSLTESAFGSHPCRVVSVSYGEPPYFHGGNAGSNPAGDANIPQIPNSVNELKIGMPK